MGRKNENKKFINYDNTIKKSNQLSMAKLNEGLSLNQMQLFAYAIFSTQQDGKSSFRKYEFKNKFGLPNYHTDKAFNDSHVVSQLQYSVENLKNKKFKFTNVFSYIEYEDGLFTFKWNEDMLLHILDLKEKYVLTDLTITSNFKSGFSWILYDYLKANYGYWNKDFSKETLMKLFTVENRKTYLNSSSDFKRGVLDVAIDEINKHTELEVWYTEKKVGNVIKGFTLHWSTGKRVSGATKKQVTLLKEIHDEVENNMFDYFALKNSKGRDLARSHIIKLKEINRQVNEELNSEKAKGLISEAKELYKHLQDLLENDEKKRDTSIYYNWLEDKD